ncbi:alkaline shock response membrane anchor protein AmaP [Williamsia deligens]|uniref:Alkaline shock response membrane anchor protein AmaP n=1 Tax=Williamsia deligens TaxID=321325 RepID=A0ABW3GA46_9NOCA|nr:alkaline shock response membrane anchor protein AmaP [Williamsia deligens]MCP2193615.1 hypothetical protein [Williamsia deligens]
MNALPAGVNRLITFLLGAVFIVVGAGAIAWELKVRQVRDQLDKVDLSWFERAPREGWWLYVLIGIAVGGILIGLLLLALNSRPRKTGAVVLPGSDASGTLSVNPSKIAAAVADDLERHRLVSSTRSRAVDDRKRKLVEVTVVADADRDFAELAELVGRAEQQVAAALPGSEIRPRFQIHLNTVKKPVRVS